MRPEIEKLGNWSGIGFVMVYRPDFVQEACKKTGVNFTTAMEGLSLHEYVHFAAPHAPHRVIHDEWFVRCLLHIWYRGWKLASWQDDDALFHGAVSRGFHSIADYYDALSGEAIKRRGEPLRDVAHSQLPERFQKLWEHDIVAAERRFGIVA